MLYGEIKFTVWAKKKKSILKALQGFYTGNLRELDQLGHWEAIL